MWASPAASWISLRGLLPPNTCFIWTCWTTATRTAAPVDMRLHHGGDLLGRGAFCRLRYNMQVDEAKSAAYALQARRVWNTESLTRRFCGTCPARYSTLRRKTPRQLAAESQAYYSESERVEAGVEACAGRPRLRNAHESKRPFLHGELGDRLAGLRYLCS